MSFHVPEHLRFRMPGHPLDSEPGDPFGAFFIAPCHLLPWGLKIIASNGVMDGKSDTMFEHVSVSRLNSPDTPSWNEMIEAAKLFWDDDDCLVQYRPPAADYVNLHPGVLHWWRWKSAMFPLPPKACV